MATKKDTKPSAADVTSRGTGTAEEKIEDRKRRKREAVTVDGTESFPPPGMDLPDGGTVPLDEGENP